MKPFAGALFLIVIAFVFLGALAMMVIPPAEAHRNLEYPMVAQATEPPPMPDLGSGRGFMFDATRWSAYVVDGPLFLYSPGESMMSPLPIGTVLLVPALPDSI